MIPAMWIIIIFSFVNLGATSTSIDYNVDGQIKISTSSSDDFIIEFSQNKYLPFLNVKLVTVNCAKYTKNCDFKGQVLDNGISLSDYDISAVGNVDDISTLKFEIYFRGEHYSIYPSPNDSHHIYFNSNQNPQNDRSKRSTTESELKYCFIKIIVQYSIQNRMNFSKNEAYQLASQQIEAANDVFLSTQFSETGYLNNSQSVFGGYQFVMQDFSFNETKEEANCTLNQNSLEDYLTNTVSDINYCIVLVLSNCRILGVEGILNGLSAAYEPSLELSKTEKSRGAFKRLNAAIVTFEQCDDYFNLKCFMAGVHEFGHLMGSSHDPESDECGSSHKGSYLMSLPFLYSSGSNNFVFSPCSKREMWNFFQLNDNNFFKESNGKCEDSFRFNNERCEPGTSYFENFNFSKCCGSDCNLAIGSKCTPENSRCCTDTCQFKPNTEICSPVELNYCLEESFCDGFSDNCPRAKQMPDGARCLNNGTCIKGSCIAQCPPYSSWNKTENDQSECANLEYPCHLNCYDEERENCVPHIVRHNGYRCTNNTNPGQCIDGVCIEFSLIQKTDFTKSNITELVITDPTIIEITPSKPFNLIYFILFGMFFIIMATITIIICSHRKSHIVDLKFSRENTVYQQVYS